MTVAIPGLLGVLAAQTAQADQQQGIDKSKLPKVREETSVVPTRLLGDLITGGGVIEYIVDNNNPRSCNEHQ
ncbi:MAG: hypothetical protein R3C05_18750 [Pirellulaceae bacterium]